MKIYLCRKAYVPGRLWHCHKWIKCNQIRAVYLCSTSIYRNMGPIACDGRNISFSSTKFVEHVPTSIRTDVVPQPQCVCLAHANPYASEWMMALCAPICMLCWVLTSAENRSTVILFNIIIIFIFGVFGLRARRLPSDHQSSAYKMN